MLNGNNTITGNGFLRQRDGGVVTCAGGTVYLIPVTSYANERITAIDGQIDGVAFARTAIKFEPDIPEYHKYIRKTTCDAQGNFEFKNVGNGEFYVQVGIAWNVFGYNPIFDVPTSNVQGGDVIAKVSVKNGESQKVIVGK